MSRPRTITTRNAAFQEWQALLTNRSKRNRTGTMLVQGVRPVTLALEAGLPLHAVLELRGGTRSHWATSTVETARRAGAQAFQPAPELMRELGEKEEETPEVLLVAGVPDDDLAFRASLVASEALTNAIEHGNRLDAEKRVTLRLAATPALVQIEVTDEGEGFDPDAGGDDGNPLGMAERDISFRVDVSAYLDTKRAALGAHASQPDAAGILAMPAEAFNAGFGTEHYIDVAAMQAGGLPATDGRGHGARPESQPLPDGWFF